MDNLEFNMTSAWAERAKYWQTMYQRVLNAPGLFNLEVIRKEYAQAQANMQIWEA